MLSEAKHPYTRQGLQGLQGIGALRPGEPGLRMTPPKTRRIPASAIALLLCLLPVLAAGQNATVYGSVSDSQGKPAGGVVIALDNSSIGFHQTATSAADGGFRFRQVPPASGYQVVAIMQEHEVSARFVTVNVDDQKEVWPPLLLPPPAENPAPVSNSANPLLATAVIYGRVFDSNSKPMSGAVVKLSNDSNHFSKAQVTTAEGSYQFDRVPPGNGYRLMAYKGGKAFDARYPVEALANEEKNILPPLRRIPELAVAVETVSTALSGVITGEQLRGLPLYNRNFLALGLLTPEVHDVEQGSELAGASFSISGARPSSNNFLLDGSDNVASSSNQAVPFQVNDSIQEFRVISSNAPAEYGRNLGGVVNVVTQRGGSAFHGSAYGYFANDALNAGGPLSIFNGTTFDKAAAYAGSPSITNLGVGPPPAPQTAYFPLRYNDYVNIARNSGFCTDSIAGPLPNPSTCVAARAGANTFFDPAAILQTRDNSKRPFDSKQFGASAGGALKKSKLFAFGSYEGTRISNPNPIFERVPSAFDKSFNPLNAPTTFPSSPSSRNMFSLTSPDYRLAQAVLSLFPSSNVVGVPGVLEFFQGQAPNYTHVQNALLRADWVKTDKTTLSARYVTQVLKQLHDDSLPAPVAAGGYAGNGAFRHALNQNVTVVLTRSFSSSMINEARFSMNRFNVHETAQDLSFDARSLAVAGNNFPNPAMPTIVLNGLDPRYSGAYLGVDGAVGGWAEIISSPTLCSGQPNCVFNNPLPRMAPTLDGFFPFARIGPPLNTPNARIDTTIAGADSLSFGHGGHDMKLGFAIRALTNQVRNGAYQRGFLYSANIGEFGHDSETCNQACTARVFPGSAPNAPPNAFLRPSFDFARFDGAPLAGDFRSWAPAFFFQDSWRVSPRLTLNLGARYEYFSPPQDRRGRTWNFDPVAHGLVPSTGSPTTVDPYGNPCNSVDSAGNPLDRSLPLGGFHFPSAGSWRNCAASGDPSIVLAEHRDFAPRLGMAWDVSGNGKTVLRIGAGIFWDQLPANYLSQLIFNRPVTGSNAVYGQLIDARVCPRGTLPFSAAGCGLGNSILDPARRGQSDLSGTLPNSYFSEAAFPFAMYARDAAHSGTPLALQSNLTVQRQISNKLALEVGYVGALGRRLPLIFNSRAATEFDLSAARFPINTFPVFTMTNQGESDYHSLVARLRAAQWHGWRMNAAYSFSRSLDNASSSLYYTEPITLDAIAAQEIVSADNPGSACFLPNLVKTPVCPPLTFPNIDFRSAAVTTTGAAPILVTPYTFPQDPLHFLSDERGRSDFDVTHRLVLDYTWEVSSLRGGFAQSRWLNYWQLSGIFVAQSGQPFTIFSTLPAVAELTQRVNLAGSGPALNMSDPAAAISTNGLALPLPNCAFQYMQQNTKTFCTGNSRRNAFTGSNYLDLDFALQKGFPVRGESRMLTIRAEIYNLFNRKNYYNPISEFSTDGVNLNPDFGKIKSAHDPLQLQFAARFAW